MGRFESRSGCRLDDRSDDTRGLAGLLMFCTDCLIDMDTTGMEPVGVIYHDDPEQWSDPEWWHQMHCEGCDNDFSLDLQVLHLFQ
jgi:hypothetical protein